MEPTGAYWLGDLVNNLAAGALALVVGLGLLSWLTGYHPAAIVTAALDRLFAR
jgi:hypothetical protein